MDEKEIQTTLQANYVVDYAAGKGIHVNFNSKEETGRTFDQYNYPGAFKAAYQQAMSTYYSQHRGSSGGCTGPCG